MYGEKGRRRGNDRNKNEAWCNKTDLMTSFGDKFLKMQKLTSHVPANV